MSFGSAYSSDDDDGTSVADVDVVGAWEMVWKEGGGEGPLRRITFEGCVAGCVALSHLTPIPSHQYPHTNTL